jgi:hypothetical protein
MKKVGRRRQATDINASNRLLELVIKLRGDQPFIPKGIHKFKTFQEAQDWSIKMMARKKIR